MNKFLTNEIVNIFCDHYTECLRKMSPVFNIFISYAKIGIFWFCFLQKIDSFMYRCSIKNYDDNLISFY